MAAPLGTDSTWITGPCEDLESEQGSYYQESEEPFLDGLEVRNSEGVADRYQIPFDHLYFTDFYLARANHQARNYRAGFPRTLQ